MKHLVDYAALILILGLSFCADSGAGNNEAMDITPSGDGVSDVDVGPEVDSGLDSKGVDSGDMVDSADEPEADGVGVADVAPDVVVKVLPTPRVSAQFPFGAVVVPVVINTLAPTPFLLDTGSPYLLVTPGLMDQLGGQPVRTVEFGGQVFTGLLSTKYNLDKPSGLLGVQLAGILGYSVLQNFVIAFDYRNSVVYPLSEWKDSYDFGPHVSGGFETTVFTLAKKNVIVMSARFENLAEPVQVLVDTGTSSAVVSASLFSALGADTDGRKLLVGSKNVGAPGEEGTVLFRLKSVEIGTRSATKTWASVSTDEFFDQVSDITGHSISAIIGGGFLREFLGVVDYPGRSLRLAEYVDTDHVINEFQMVGVEVFRDKDGYEVYTVFEGSDAQIKGVRTGDRLIQIADQPTIPMDMTEVMSLLRGDPGITVRLKLTRGDIEYEADVLREDLLPYLDTMP